MYNKQAYVDTVIQMVNFCIYSFFLQLGRRPGSEVVTQNIMHLVPLNNFSREFIPSVLCPRQRLWPIFRSLTRLLDLSLP